MSELDHFSDMCRLCLSKNHQNIDIFSEEGLQNGLQSKILTLFSVLVKADENLPRRVCDECLRHLNFISTYRIKVENAQRTILSLLPYNNVLSAKSIQMQNLVNNCDIDTTDPKSEASEALIICEGVESIHESNENNDIKEESLSEDNSRDNPDFRGGSESECNRIFPVSQGADFVEVDHVGVPYSPGDSRDRLSDSDSSHNKQIKKGTKRRGKKLKQSRNHKTGEDTTIENMKVCNELLDTTKQPVWTKSMGEEIQNFYQFTCELCSDSQPYRTFNSLSKHFRSAHDTEGYFKCCKRKMYCRSQLYQHMILHTRPEMYKCPECDKQLCGPVNLKQHLQLFHLPRTELPFRCSVCGRGFATKTAVENHEKSQHLLSDAEKFVHECDLCEKRFASISGVAEHKKRVHAQIRPLLCDVCAKAFPNQSRLRKHMTCHNDSENLKCPHCDKRLKNYWRLQVHVKRHQGVVHSCPECEKSYPTRRLLQRHIKTHSDERPHECSICGKRYREKSHLKMHFNQHTGALPFSCQWCPKRFSASGPFYTHRKKMHPEELAKATKAAAPASQP